MKNVWQIRRLARLRYRLGLLFTLAVLGGLSFWVAAHQGATGIVKERMDLMESVEDSMKALKNIMRGQVKYNAETVQIEAKNIANHASEMLQLFPEGSLDHPTQSKSVIWKDWDNFSDLARQMQDFSISLYKAAANESIQKPTTILGENVMSGNLMGGGEATMEPDHSIDDPVVLQKMPPQVSFQRLAQTCKDCHTDFRTKKEE